MDVKRGWEFTAHRKNRQTGDVFFICAMLKRSFTGTILYIAASPTDGISYESDGLSYYEPQKTAFMKNAKKHLSGNKKLSHRLRNFLIHF
jgi:hypothetical protein